MWKYNDAERVMSDFPILLPMKYCTNRVDSMMLVEEGFQVTSIDASDKMLKYALKSRWNRRKEKSFDNWGEKRSLV